MSAVLTRRCRGLVVRQSLKTISICRVSYWGRDGQEATLCTGVIACLANMTTCGLTGTVLNKQVEAALSSHRGKATVLQNRLKIVNEV